MPRLRQTSVVCNCQMGAGHTPTCPRVFVVPWIVVAYPGAVGNDDNLA